MPSAVRFVLALRHAWAHPEQSSPPRQPPMILIQGGNAGRAGLWERYDVNTYTASEVPET